jgi:two-component system sensor histidine kinase PhoQ
MVSMRRRLILSVSVSLILFFGLTIAGLDAAFRGFVDRSVEDLLDAQMLALMAAAEPGTDGVAVTRVTDPRLEVPGSGLYAAIAWGDGTWRSSSTAGAFVDFGEPLAAGARRSSRAILQNGSTAVLQSRGIEWTGDDGVVRALTFSLAVDLAPYAAQIARFRTQVFGWFALLALVLLATLAWLLRRTLAPLAQLGEEIHGIESGARERLSDRWPRELTGVATNLNALIAAERERIGRYRKTLGNLAHSLKTPLAVLRASLHGSKALDEARKPIDREIDRMSAIVDHQLRRAATSGGATMGQAAVAVLPIVSDLRAALLRAHSRKDFAILNAVQPDIRFVGDAEDFAEILGNSLDNAAKWCASQVRVSASLDPAAGPRASLRVVIEDDGPGIADADRERVLERGARADESAPGHGLGLAMVRDAVESYGGSLTIGRSALGGAQLTIALPGR